MVELLQQNTFQTVGQNNQKQVTIHGTLADFLVGKIVSFLAQFFYPSSSVKVEPRDFPKPQLQLQALFVVAAHCSKTDNDDQAAARAEPAITIAQATGPTFDELFK